MRVVERRRRAASRAVRGRRRGADDTLVDVELVAPVAPGDLVLVHAGVALAAARKGAARMKFVDEFRDAQLGRVLAGEILATVEPGRHYKIMEVCGGHTHSIYKYGVDDLLPANVELVHGPGCPVLRDPDGPRRRRHRDRPRAGRHLHGVRRHAARARRQRDDARRQGGRAPTSASSTRRSTRCGSRARTRTARSSSSRSASRRPRRRRRSR